MKRNQLLLLLLLTSCTMGPTVTFVEQDKTISVEVADTPLKQMKGLMFRDKLDADAGMLFIFRSEKPRSFWMKNTTIPLDLIFLSANGTIIDIKENFEPCETLVCPSYRSQAPAQHVVEVNAGFASENDIQVGHKVVITSTP